MNTQLARPATSTRRPETRSSPGRAASGAPARQVRGVTRAELDAWLDAFVLNTSRHEAALRPFRPDEFGTGAAAPSQGHVSAVNTALAGLRGRLAVVTQRVTRGADAARRDPSPQRLRDVVTLAEAAHSWVRATERVWDFYLELFGQRQSAYAPWLRACDRIALDSYQHAYLGLGAARTVPAPGPFSYMRTGFSPATWRRGIPLRRAGVLANPFPLVQLPYHRLVNPWTLGAVLHEVSHNLQDDLGLQQAVPRRLATRLSEEGLPDEVVRTWVRWHRESFADLFGLLLGGPGVVASLLDILARSPAAVTTWNPRAVHPLPLLRPQLSFELLRRNGFGEDERRYRTLWERTYAGLRPQVPRAVLATAPHAVRTAVEVMCFTPYPSLGGRRLSEVVRFGPKEQAMAREAGERLARGLDPGVVPERFLIGAARHALDERLASPGVIARMFYRDLGQR